MSQAPANLIELRRQMAAWTGAKRSAFGIRGFCGAKRTTGYHLAKGDPCLTERDYSLRHPRDKQGYSQYAAGFDISLPVATLKPLLAWMVQQARMGKLDIAEVIGPNDNGDATDYRWPDFKGLVRKDPKKRDGHRRHIHVSFRRDLTHPSSQADLRPMFAPYFGNVGPLPDDPVLKLGSEGPDVVEAQERLNIHGADLLVDGKFGALTEAAVKAFQEAEGLTVDGIIGQATWDALNDEPRGEPDPELVAARERIAELETAIDDMVNRGQAVRHEDA
jgi:hypothetical protein